VTSSKTERDQWIASETPQASKKSSEIITGGESEVVVVVAVVRVIRSINETSFQRRAIASGKSDRHESTEDQITLKSCELSLLKTSKEFFRNRREVDWTNSPGLHDSVVSDVFFFTEATMHWFGGVRKC
jgi:hypothetical protein